MLYELDGILRVKMFGKVSQKHGAWHNGNKPVDNIVLYCIDGEINMEMAENHFLIKPGDLLLIPRGTLYRPLPGGSCRYYFYHFKTDIPSDVKNIPNNIIIAPHTGLNDGFAYTCMSSYRSVVDIPLHVKNVPHYVSDILIRAEQLRPNANFVDQLLLDNSLRELLIHMAKSNLPQYSKNLTAILQYIENHYFENLGISSLSQEFSLSQSYIARLFKKELSKKPSEYINGLRISVAKTMLLETDLSVAQIAEKVGFSDIYYFSRVFKKLVGISPAKTRNRK